MEDKQSVKQRVRKSKEASVSKQDGLKSQHAKDGCQLKGTCEATVRDGSQQNEKIEQLSQAVQLYSVQIPASEKVLQQEEQAVQELLEKCNRQQQNLCELQCSIEHMNIKYCDQVKSREAATAKYMETTQMIQALNSACNTVTSSLHRIFEGYNTVQLHFEESRNESKQMNISVDEMMASLPTIEDLTRILQEEEQKTVDLEIEHQRKLDAARKQFKVIEESAMTELSGLEKMIQDLDVEILSVEHEAENESKLCEAECKESNQELHCLQRQIGDLIEKISFSDKELVQTQDQIGAATIEVENIESELSVKKLREENLANDMSELIKSEEELKESLSARESDVQKLEQELDAERNQNTDLNAEIEEMRGQIQMLKNNVSSQVEALSSEYQSVVATSNEREASLQKLLDELRAELGVVTKKEQDLIEESRQIENELQCLSDIYSQALQSKSTLESDLVACEDTLEELKKEKKRTEEYLAIKRADVENTQQSLLQMQTNNETLVNETRIHIAHLKKEETSAIESLNKLTLSEQDYQSKIEAIKVKTAQLCAQMNELHMQQTKEFEEDIRCVEKDIELLASESEKCLSEFCGNMKSLGELDSKKNKILLHLNATIEKHKVESEKNACQLYELAEEKKERTKRVNELNEKASQLTKEIEIRQERHQENSLSVEKDEMKLKEVNDLIAGLEIGYNTLQSEHMKFVTDSETDKQVYLKGLQDFQNTSNLRLEEVKALQKQINVWKDKVNKEKASHKGDDACSDLKVNAESSRVGMTEVEKSVQEWEAKVSTSEAEASKAETEAGITRRILEQLKSKIAAHRAEKDKRLVKSQEPVFKVPTPVFTTQKVVTPQFSATVSSDTELTPRSILKTSSKSPTPQQRKSVSFFDFDDGSSSSSSIMLDPDMIDRIAANPAAKSIIEAQHRERQEAKRKLVTESLNEISTPAKKINIDNEISSSTPESNEVQDQDIFDFL